MKLRIFETFLKRAFLLLVCVSFVQIGALASPKTYVEEVTNTKESTSILQEPGFKAFEKTLRRIVLERSPEAKKPQHFFVSKYPKGETLTYMFWQEQKLLWVMNVGGIDEESWLGLRYPSSGQLIDLKTSVVRSAGEVGGSSFLVTKDWAAIRLFDAVILGDGIIITP